MMEIMLEQVIIKLAVMYRDRRQDVAPEIERN